MTKSGTLKTLILIPALIFVGSCFRSSSTPKPGKVIIINGPSAGGKSSILKAFQAQEKEPWLCAGIDKLFVEVLHEKFFLEDNAAKYKIMKNTKSQTPDGKPVFGIEMLSMGKKILRGMHSAIAGYAKAGCDVIVDYISYSPEQRDELLQTLSGLETVLVGISADLKQLEQRELSRGTSPEGHARSHYKAVHEGWKYDLEIDTTQTPPEKTAALIASFVKQKFKS